MVIDFSPNLSRLTEDLKDLPINLWISIVRPLCLFFASLLILSFVDLGNIPYSAVTHPIFFPFKKRGTLFSIVALHITLVFPNSTKTEPSG